MFSYFILSLSGIEENALPPFLLLFLRFQRLTLQTYCVYISTFYPCPWIHQNLWLPPGLSSCLNFVFLLYTEGQHVDLGLWGQRLLLFSCSVTSYSLWPLELQHARLPRPSSSPGACLNSCPLSQWYHQTISSSVISFSSCFQTTSSSVVSFSSCFQYLPMSGSFPVSWLFASGVQNIVASASASVLPMNIQD